jgi:Mrp family chromosome partitioning ATPase
LPDRDPDQIREAVRALCLETGILGYDKAPKVVLISTPLTDDLPASLSAQLAETLVEAGRRVLSIDANPFSGKLEDGEALAMERALMDEQAFLEGLLHRHGADRLTVLHRGGADGASPLQSVDRLVAAARKSYDVALIRAAPVLTSSDALRLVSIADIHLHVVRWQETRRRPTLLAVQRFRKIDARISGVVLVDANLRRYRQYRAADQFYYSGGDSVAKHEAHRRDHSLNKKRAAAK